MEDRQIVELYWSREETAVTESSAKYGGYCYAIAFRILCGREDAEECVNDTWLRAWNAMPPRRPERLDTFFGRLTRNLSLDRWRSLRAAKRTPDQTALALEELAECAAPGGVEETLDAAALTASLDRFLASLPREKRVLFLRRYWYLCSVRDIAAQTGRKEAAVAAALFRLRNQLRAHLEKEGFAL